MPGGLGLEGKAYTADDFVVGVHLAAESVGLRVFDLRWRQPHERAQAAAGVEAEGGRRDVRTSISRKFSGGP